MHVHRNIFTHLSKNIHFVSSVSKLSKVVDMVSAKVHADNKMHVPLSNSTQKEKNACISAFRTLCFHVGNPNSPLG